VGVGVLAAAPKRLVGALPKPADAGADAPKPADAGAGAPKPEDDVPKLNVVDAAAGEGLAVFVPNPPKAGRGAGAAAGDAAAGAADPKLNAGGFAGDEAAGGAPKENGELAAGFGDSADLPKEKDGVVDGAAAGAGAGEPKLNAGAGAAAGVVLVCVGAPNRLGVEAGAVAFTSAGAGAGAGAVVFPNENMLLPLVVSAGFAAGVLVDGVETPANGFPTGNDDATADGITGAALGVAVVKLNSPALGGATLSNTRQ
jgi:hypothetical protein